jgi:ABC-type transport system involved in multi-copper enzyme maturation permease subunit
MKVIYSIAATSVGEAIRRKVLLIILLAGLLLLSILPGFSILSARGEAATLVSTMYFVLQGTSVMIAVILTVYMIPNEIERRTIYTILSKPVQRWQFLLGKYFGAVFSLALMMGLMTAVMLILFYLSQNPGIERLAEVGKAPILYFVQMCLLAAVAIFFSTFVAPLVNFFLTLGLYLVGTALNPLYESFAQNPDAPNFVRVIAQVVTSLLPNFGNYNVANPIIHPEVLIQSDLTYYTNATLYGLIYISGLLIAGMIIFDRREV